MSLGDAGAGPSPPRGRRAIPLRVYFAALVALFVLAAGAAAAYVHVQTRRDGRHAAEADARYAARTGEGRITITQP